MDMYRCEICCNVSPSGQHMLRHTIYRKVEPRDVKNRVKDHYGNFRTVIRTEPERIEIAREVALCATCYEQVSSGVSITTVAKSRGIEYREYVSPVVSNNIPRKIKIEHTVVEEQPSKVTIVGAITGRTKLRDLPNNSLNGSPRPTLNREIKEKKLG